MDSIHVSGKLYISVLCPLCGDGDVAWDGVVSDYAGAFIVLYVGCVLMLACAGARVVSWCCEWYVRGGCMCGCMCVCMCE